MNVNILVVGAGGTGGNYLKELARYVYSLPRETKESINISIMDGDMVEERNIARQPFAEMDVGVNKALAMTCAIQEVFGLKRVKAFPFYLENEKQIEASWMAEDCRAGSTVYLLVGCVDNHHARKIMHNYFQNSKVKNLIYLDSANEFSVGECVIAMKFQKKVVAPDRQYYYPDIFKGKLKSASELSCLEVNEIAPQHLVTNMLAANILLGQTVSIFSNKIRGGIVYFDAFQAASRFVAYKEKDAS